MEDLLAKNINNKISGELLGDSGIRFVFGFEVSSCWRVVPGYTMSFSSGDLIRVSQSGRLVLRNFRQFSWQTILQDLVDVLWFKVPMLSLHDGTWLIGWFEPTLFHIPTNGVRVNIKNIGHLRNIEPIFVLLSHSYITTFLSKITTKIRLVFSLLDCSTKLLQIKH